MIGCKKDYVSTFQNTAKTFYLVVPQADSVAVASRTVERVRIEAPAVAAHTTPPPVHRIAEAHRIAVVDGCRIVAGQWRKTGA